MVAPHPDLQRKINNTDNIVKNNKSHLVSDLHRKYPGDYISLDTHDVLIRAKPWIEELALSLSPNSVSTNYLNSVSPNYLNSVSPSIQNLWGPFFTTIDKVLVLCVDFSDLPAQTTIPIVNDRFFSTTGDSFLNYYKEVSYSKWIPSGNVHGWYRAPNPYTYYINNNNGYGTYPNNARKLVEDTIDIAIADPAIDWTSFDINNNGNIDNIIVVHAGAEAAWSGATNLFWAHSSTITTTKYAQGKSINKYVLTAEYTYSGASQRIGVDCHEFAHLLNLPDLYDNSGNSNGVGYYSLMGVGNWGDNGLKPTHLDAWSKYKLGFMDITANPQGLVIVNNVEINADAIKYTTVDPKEYFLIENRQKIMFDTYLPSDGLLIWHINENRSNNNNETCFLAGLIQADGFKDLENKINNGDTGDSYPGSTNKRSFGAATNPNSQLCDATIRDMSITNISNSGNSMTFNATVPPIISELATNCVAVTVVSPPHIEATTMTITKSADPCITGTCTVTVNVTWRNTGGVSGIFTPTILIDSTPVTLAPVTLNAFETVGDSIIRTFTLPDLTGASHTICPDPN
jgi:immune inhibitor A